MPHDRSQTGAGFPESATDSQDHDQTKMKLMKREREDKEDRGYKAAGCVGWVPEVNTSACVMRGSGCKCEVRGVLFFLVPAFCK